MTETTLAALTDLLSRARFGYANEKTLHEGIAAALTDAGYRVEREVTLTSRCRIDFLIDGVGVEVKTQGSPGPVLAQLGRYAACPQIRALLLVTTRSTLTHVPPVLHGTPVAVCIPGRAWL